MKHLFSPPDVGSAASLGLLLLRITAGLGLVFHGYGKIQNPMGWMGADSWAPGLLQGLAAFAEFGGGLALLFGLLTPLACIGILCVMAAAMTTVHFPAGHEFVAKGKPSYELAMLYFSIGFSLLLTGPGAFALDALLFKKKLVNPIVVKKRQSVLVP